MNKPTKVNVLGTEYKIVYESREKNKGLAEALGYVDFFIKEIHIQNELFEKEKEGDFTDLYKQGFKTLRHEIIKRKKVENEYVETVKNYSFPRLFEPLFRRKKIVNEYEQFRCNVKHKMATLESWDFDFCPFCGMEMKE